MRAAPTAYPREPTRVDYRDACVDAVPNLNAQARIDACVDPPKMPARIDVCTDAEPMMHVHEGMEARLVAPAGVTNGGPPMGAYTAHTLLAGPDGHGLTMKSGEDSV